MFQCLYQQGLQTQGHYHFVPKTHLAHLQHKLMLKTQTTLLEGHLNCFQ